VPAARGKVSGVAPALSASLSNCPPVLGGKASTANEVRPLP
jgi:hypothetical protein